MVKKKKVVSKKTRTGVIKRKTKETDIDLSVKLDGKGSYSIKTNEPFLSHMIEQFAKHSGISINIKAKGDVEIDSHHLTEDIGIALGSAINKALGNKKGIKRFGSAGVLDEALVLIALDISGRSYCEANFNFKTKKIGTFDTELVSEFFHGFARGAMITLHVEQIKGINTHHVIEAAFKGFAVAMRDAVSVVGKALPSTKGKI